MEAYRVFKEQYLSQNPFATNQETWNSWKSMSKSDKATYGADTQIIQPSKSSAYQNFKYQYKINNMYASDSDIWALWKSMSKAEKSQYDTQPKKSSNINKHSNAYQKFKASYLQNNPYGSPKDSWSIWNSMSGTDKSLWEQSAGAKTKTTINKCANLDIPDLENNFNSLTPDQLKCSYLNFIYQNENRNNNIPVNNKGDNILRIATFNIHYFTDVWEANDTYADVLLAIKNLNPDIIVLQEALIGGDNITINPGLKLDLSDLYPQFEQLDYLKIVVCNSVPSWFPAVYGNILLVKNEFLDKCVQDWTEDSAKKEFQINRDKIVCEMMDENVFTFSKAEESTIVAGGQKGTMETRCYIYIKFPYKNRNIHIYGTHLDVATEANRLTQINRIIKDIEIKMKNDPTTENDIFIVTGDFNSHDPKQYVGTQLGEQLSQNRFLKDNGKVVQALKKAGFTDAHQNNPAPLTTWSNVRVDFIFIKDNLALLEDKNPLDIVKNADVYFTDSSDHIPVFIDLPL